MRSTSPLVTIGLITYNRGTILHLAVDQLLGQSYKNIELLISDNASTDRTQSVCEQYARRDSRVRYFRQEKNIGMYNNFNFVLNKAQGQYFLWATDDDEWNPHFIERMMSLHEKYPSAVVATSNYTLFSNNYREITHFPYPEILRVPESIRIFLHGAVLITYGVIKTSALQQSGGFFRYPWPIPDGIGDSVLNIKILLHGDVAFDQEPLWKKRDSGYTCEKFSVLSSLFLTSEIRYRIHRYLLFPLLYGYNLYFMSREILFSKYRIYQKSILLWLMLQYILKSYFEYIKNVIIGIISLLTGLMKVLLKI